MRVSALIWWLAAAVVAAVVAVVADMEDTEFTNTWVAEIHGGESIARRVARDHGYVYEGPVDSFDDHYVLTRDDHPEVSKRNSLHLTRSLTDLEEVKWAEQQAIVKRAKRGIIPDEFPEELLAIPRAFDAIIPEDHKPYVPRGSGRKKKPQQSNNNDMFALLMQQMNGGSSDSFFDNAFSNNWSNPWSSSNSWSIPSSWSFSDSPSSPSSWSYSNSWSSDTGNSGSAKPANSGSAKPGSSGSATPGNSGSAKPGNSGSSPPSSWSYSWSSDPGNSGSAKPGNSGSAKPGNSGSSPPSSWSYSWSSDPGNSGSTKPGSSGSTTPGNSGSAKPGNSGSSAPQSSSYSSSYSGSIPLSYFPSLAAEKEGSGQRETKKLGIFPTVPLDKSILDTYAGVTKHVGSVSTKKSAYEQMFNDPLWTKQWYTQDYRTSNMPVMDHNVVPVYRKGITGKGIKVAVVDDGVEHGHPDLQDNFMESLSYDMCNNKVGSEPDPAYQGHPNSHGTKCAGEIAMVANNSKCGVGIAYDSKVAGIKTLGKRSYDLVEARGLVYKLDAFDIYSNSWGPSDDGRTMEKMGSMVAKSILKGVTQGRKGRGVIYTFAAGNGRHQGDNCAADGFINNPYTIPIASVSQHGKVCYYSERCTAVFAATYSGGNRYDEKVATIDLDGKCATDFSGTSAATPIATGIIALTLQANPNLSYRDMMHIITMTAEVAPVANNEDIWYKNGRGFWVSNDFGFGLLNADNMVSAARDWTTVPNKTSCVLTANLQDPQYLTVGQNAKIQFTTAACKGTADAVNFLEQIEVASTVDYPHRGALSITITSPAGTKSDLLETRASDDSRNGLKEWSIKSVHNWGENPRGTWVIEVAANALQGVKAASGYVQGFTVTFHGTARKPAHYNKTPVRTYSAFRLPNGRTSELLLKKMLKIFIEIMNELENK